MTRFGFTKRNRDPLKKILHEIEKIYDGDDQLNESVVEDIYIRMKAMKSNGLPEHLNYKEIIKEYFKEIETFQKVLLIMKKN